MFFNINTTALLTGFLTISVLFSTIAAFVIYRILRVLTRTKPKSSSKSNPINSTNLVSQKKQNTSRSTSDQQHGNSKGHLLIVLGSGGHTAEMLSILQNLGAEYLNTRCSRRTWVVSTGDGFSAERARVFEEKISREWTSVTKSKRSGHENGSAAELREVEAGVQWDIATVTRARKVHQPLSTTPRSALVCLWDCIRVLQGIDLKTGNQRTDKTAELPDLILTNGPGTGVMVVLASLVLLTLGMAPLHGKGSMRCVYIESWARVKTLSLSGKILRWMVSRFLVQWEGLADVDATMNNTAVPDMDKDKPKKDSQTTGLVSIKGNGGSFPRRIEFVGAVVT